MRHVSVARSILGPSPTRYLPFVAYYVLVQQGPSLACCMSASSIMGQSVAVVATIRVAVVVVTVIHCAFVC